MTLCIPAKVLLHVWSYDFYDMTLSTGKQRRHMIKLYMNLKVTKCTFGHSDITSRKQQKAKKLYNMRYRNNTVFVIFEHWGTK